MFVDSAPHHFASFFVCRAFIDSESHFDEVFKPFWFSCRVAGRD